MMRPEVWPGTVTPSGQFTKIDNTQKCRSLEERKGKKKNTWAVRARSGCICWRSGTRIKRRRRWSWSSSIPWDNIACCRRRPRGKPWRRTSSRLSSPVQRRNFRDLGGWFIVLKSLHQCGRLVCWDPFFCSLRKSLSKFF